MLVVFTLFTALPAYAESEDTLTKTNMTVVGSALPPMASLGEQVAKSTLYIIGAIFLVVALIKRFYKLPNGNKAHDGISIISRKNISRETGLIIANIEGKRYLLGFSPTSMQLLTCLSDRLPEATLKVQTEKDFQGNAAKISMVSSA